MAQDVLRAESRNPCLCIAAGKKVNDFAHLVCSFSSDSAGEILRAADASTYLSMCRWLVSTPYQLEDMYI